MTRLHPSLALLAALLAGPAPAASPAAVVEALAGWWDEGLESAGLCSPGRNLHRHVLSADGRRITWELEREIKRHNGAMTRTYTYDILGAETRSLTLRLVDEVRTIETGDPIVWELVLVAPDTFRWRATHWSEPGYNRVVGKRCRRDEADRQGQSSIIRPADE